MSSENNVVKMRHLNQTYLTKTKKPTKNVTVYNYFVLDNSIKIPAVGH